MDHGEEGHVHAEFYFDDFFGVPPTWPQLVYLAKK